MKVAVFGTKSYDEEFLTQENTPYGHELVFLEANLNATTAALARGFSAVCAFVNDDLCEACLEILAEAGVTTIALRCAGYNNLDLKAAARLGMTIVRVPAYSPHGVAEHADQYECDEDRHAGSPTPLRPDKEPQKMSHSTFRQGDSARDPILAEEYSPFPFMQGSVSLPS